MCKLSVFFSIGAMILLYLLGFIADINVLMFKMTPDKTEIALLPLAVGLLLAMISDRIIKNKKQG
ncbi:hypothetical protein [Bacillus sinesaloumensis]|uniref:hypothetical protein n=1 Tax=Litchfieldia sinesaloumensis TaxID=1926280 RepID=UPI00098851F2|nr:hypothetical protein [Bacillus sinesaloumensis]